MNEKMIRENSRDFHFGDSQIFSRLSSSHQALLMSVAISKKLRRGDLLFLQYDAGNSIYIVLSGSIEISVTSISGKKISLNIMKKDDVFGEISALDGGKRTATATAVEDSDLLRIDRTRLLQLMHEHPMLSLDLIHVLCARLRWISQQVEDLSTLDIESRLANRLSILHNKFADQDGVLHLTQAEIAEFLGATRESVNKILQRWSAEGLLELTRGAVRIRRLDQLAERGSFE